MSLKDTLAVLGLKIIERGFQRPESEIAFLPQNSELIVSQTPFAREWRRKNYLNIKGQLAKIEMAQAAGIQTIAPALYLTKLHASGYEEVLGLASVKVVTTAGVNFLVDAFQGTVEPEILKFHGIGTGGAAEAIGNTALTTELTTQYNPDNTRATGTLAEGASANIFRTVGTNTVDAVVSITEHGIFSQAATGGGTLWDRSLFTAIALASGDALESTYEATFAAGG